MLNYRNNFNFVGFLSEGKDGKTERSFEKSQWKAIRLNFSLKENGSFHTLSVETLYKDETTPIYYIGQKKERKSVAFKERSKVDLNEVAPFSLFTLDLNLYTKDQLKYFQNHPDVAQTHNLTPEKINELMNTYDQKRKKFLSEIDFMDAIEKLLKNPKWKNMKFKVTGNVIMTKSKDKVYTAYQVQKIQLTEDDEQAITRMNFIFNEDSLDDIEEDGSFLVNGYTSNYDSKEKKNIFLPYSFRVLKVIKDTPEDEVRANDFRRKRFAITGDKLKECTIVTNVINGTQYREITEDDLSEEEKEAIFCGEVTFEELKREYKPIAGATIRENQFAKMGIGYSKGAVESDLTLGDVLGTKPKTSDDLLDKVFDDFEF